MMKDVAEFVGMSKYAGERFDLVQAGGGNSSVKTDNDIMLIKASGVALSEVELDRGFARVRLGPLLDLITANAASQGPTPSGREALAAQVVRTATSNETARASIETLMHAILGKYVLHTHPIAVNILTAKPDWQEILGPLFPEAVLVPYRTPGIELALALYDRLRDRKISNDGRPVTAFLQNHGLIISADTAAKATATTEAVIQRIERHLNLNFDAYKLVSRISGYINRQTDSPRICHQSDDPELLNLWRANPDTRATRPFCPDMLVYNGEAPLVVDDLNQDQPLAAYMAEYGGPPRVVVFRDRVFFVAPNLRKAREMESVFKFHLIVTNHLNGAVNYLSPEEIEHLRRLESEQYRQKL
ncbi:MAG: class II aldolase [Deltaproteobacteria bacterium]|nr:class II aldolase [Deltaproteobacteria bacterium]MBF0524705.1 class II aldolase [Deltaproteobacteria bacterium]